MRTCPRGLPAAAVALVLAVAAPAGGAAETPPVAPSPAASAEPPVPFGQVIYRATKAAAFESLGVTVIACRHFDPGPRQFAVDFFNRDGTRVGVFGPSMAAAVPPGKKVIFVTDGRYFRDRDVVDVRLGHLTGGPARVISDAERVRCLGRIRIDSGRRAPSAWKGIGFHREGEPPPAEETWH